jgi:hypothetical protein
MNMTDDEWYAARDMRVKQYGATPFDRKRFIAITAESEYCSTYAGQVALITASNLFGRLTPALILDLPDTPIVSPLPWQGQNLPDFLMHELIKNDPRGMFGRRKVKKDDHAVFFGRRGSSTVNHGIGWTSYCGSEPSPLPCDDSQNPIGAALSAIIVASRIFVHGFTHPSDPILINGFNWENKVQVAPALTRDSFDYPNIWVVGTGSVGTSILFFLSLFTRRFAVDLYDMDIVKRENITRSPIFCEEHVGQLKVLVTKQFLESCGLEKVKHFPGALDEFGSWKKRSVGGPDLLIATANERNVRSMIESLYPPLQIYGTTGKNWQASMLRHIPGKENCSLCYSFKGDHIPTKCATGSLSEEGQKTIDASLPFLSFAAGLMATSEILKSTLTGYPFNANRAYFYSRPEPRFCVAAGAIEEGCVCGSRNRQVHLEALGHSRYAFLSR